MLFLVLLAFPCAWIRREAQYLDAQWKNIQFVSQYGDVGVEDCSLAWLWRMCGVKEPVIVKTVRLGNCRNRIDPKVLLDRVSQFRDLEALDLHSRGCMVFLTDPWRPANIHPQFFYNFSPIHVGHLRRLKDLKKLKYIDINDTYVIGVDARMRKEGMGDSHVCPETDFPFYADIRTIGRPVQWDSKLHPTHRVHNGYYIADVPIADVSLEFAERLISIRANSARTWVLPPGAQKTINAPAERQSQPSTGSDAVESLPIARLQP